MLRTHQEGLPGAPLLRVCGLHLRYGSVAVLHGIDFELPAAGICALLGASGSGKSSFLRCLNRLNDEIEGSRVEGEVLLDGMDAYAPSTPVHELRRRIGMVFQHPAPFPLSVAGNVDYALRLAGRSNRRERADRVEAALRMAGLWDEVADRLDDNALVLSLGQQQRLVLARAIAVEPQVLLLDEPASALDPAAALRLEESLHELSARLPLLLVTHNVQQAARISDSVAYMHAGRIIESGPTGDVFMNPRDRRTEEFITGRGG